MADTGVLLGAYRELFVWDDEHPNHHVGFLCSICGQPVDDRPCPDHAPVNVPGLRLVECSTEPRHWLWVLDCEDYGAPCYRCELNDLYERQRQAEACRHWPWRRWKLTHRAGSLAYQLGVIAGSGTQWGNGCNHCLTGVRWRGKRPYLLGAQRETWRCWRQGHHRGEHVGFGYCGKCQPWPCCGSILMAHEPGCPEDLESPRLVTR